MGAGLNGWLDRLVREHGGGLTTQDAFKAGMTPAALHWARRSSALISLRRGAHTSAGLWAETSPEGRHRLRILAQQRVNPGLVACGTSAVIALGLPFPDGPPARPQVTVPRVGPHRGARGIRAGASGRRSWLRADEIWTLDDDVRVTSPLRSAVDCAREWPEPWGLALADAVIARWQL